MQMNSEEEEALDRFLHSRNQSGHTLLYLISHHQKNLFLPHSMIMHLELISHKHKSEEIQVGLSMEEVEDTNMTFSPQECIRSNLGSTKMSKKTAQVVKKRAPGPMTRVCKFLEIFLLVFLVPVGFFILDMVTDALLISDYFSDMNNSTALAEHDKFVDQCHRNLTLICYKEVMSAR